MPTKRLLIFVVAYHAEATLAKVFDRVPRSLFVDYDCEVLVIDDASTDRTYEIGRTYLADHPEFRLRVLRNRYNQGYGGNQKLGYAYAIKEGFDLVALLHGDAQYAPEELPALTKPVADGEADAVFGSRMLVPGAASRGGMPLYKLVGNKILTRIQNAVLRTSLSEFHSGYRIYAVATLRRLPFLLNSNDFHFDTEIIIQLLNLGARIVELPIPTYYGGEISRVNGLRYAKNVVVATLRNASHRAGIYYQRRYDVETGNAHYGPKLGYASSHSFAVDAVPAGSKVIDIGGGAGFIAARLAAKDCDVHIVDQHPAAVTHARVTSETRALDGTAPVSTKGYDHVLLLDVIEHVGSPEIFLESLRAGFDHDKKVLVLSTPNIAFIVQRVQLMLGQFNYGKAGILDITHKRLFTFRGIRRLLEDTGFRSIELRGVPAPFPKVLGDGRLGRAALGANLALIKLSKTLFSYQIFVVAEGTPAVDFLLEDARASGGATGGSPASSAHAVPG